MNELIAPHGGKLLECLALGPQRDKLLSEAKGLPSLTLDEWGLSDVELLAIGATMEADRDDLTPDAEATSTLRAAAKALRPDMNLDDARVDVGVRATTPDGLPLVGWSRAPGVLLAVGARRNGWLFAPLVADMAAAYLNGDNLGPDAAAMDARRFEEPET